MPNAGPANWTSSADNGSIGTIAWSGSPPSASWFSAGLDTHYLNLTGFGPSLAIPSGSTIIAIEASLSFTMGGGTASDHSVKIIKGGTVGGTEHSTGAAWGSANTYGNLTSDLWGLTWLYTDINASNFGVAVSGATGANGSATLSAATITVAYTSSGILIDGSAGSVALKYGRTRIKFRDRGRTVMETSRRGPRIFLPPSHFRKAA